LKGWRITNARLENGKAELHIPDEYKDAEERLKVTWAIGPRRELTVDPNADSVNLYTLNLSDLNRPVAFRPRSFFTGVWSGRLPPLTGTVRINAIVRVGAGGSDLEPFIPKELAPRVAGVKNLARIAQFMAVQPDETGSSGTERRLALVRDVEIQVRPSGSRRAMALGMMAVPPVFLGAFLLWLLARKDQLVLEGPNGQERFTLRAREQHDVAGADSRAVATLHRGLREYTVRPLEGFLVDNSAAPRPVVFDRGFAEFTVTDAVSQRGLRYSLAREDKPPAPAEASDYT
jgi:hypothetical protein